jgi:predicted TIM-barrel fold metal-dependent hydrolase
MQNNLSTLQMNLSDYCPQSKLVSTRTIVKKPKFQVVDAHNHLAEPFGGGWDDKPLNQLMDLLDLAGIRHFVDLDGAWGDKIFHTHLEKFKAAAPNRFSVFCGIDWTKWPELGKKFPDWAAKKIETDKASGADGLKVWKLFGLHVKDHEGNLVNVDDERLAVIWETAADLKMPVVIHVADPVAFFDPVDECNERWEELQAHPDWVFTSPPFPPFNHIIESFARLILRHSRTLFIGAHVGCYAENLAWVGKLLDECPNFYIDISGRIAELGRQPFTARRFFLKYSDRILFGLDAGPDLATYHTYYRFLETDDEYFNYNPDPEGIPDTGRWMIYGLCLPDSVLQKIYYQNAERILNLLTLD